MGRKLKRVITTPPPLPFRLKNSFAEQVGTDTVHLFQIVLEAFPGYGE
jgi:hypothetical protein